MPSKYTVSRILTLALAAVLYILCLRGNIPETTREQFALKLTLSIAFFGVWLLQAFLFGNSRGYWIFISIYFGVIALSSGLALLLREPSVWRLFFVIYPCLSFYPAFSPIGMALHVDRLDGGLPIPVPRGDLRPAVRSAPVRKIQAERVITEKLRILCEQKRWPLVYENRRGTVWPRACYFEVPHYGTQSISRIWPS